MQLSKTDFLQFSHCAKSLWLLKCKPALYEHGPFSDYLQKIVTEGYEIEAYLEAYLLAQPDANKYFYQTVFKTDEGLFAKADCTRNNDDGTINIYEVKSTTKVQRSAQKDQVKDAAFQRIAAVTSENVRSCSASIAPLRTYLPSKWTIKIRLTVKPAPSAAIL